MTETILVAGTASHVGKSTVVAGLCRYLADAGVDVTPFKAQNMSNNARVGVTPTGEWGELGVSQYVQATAAGIPPRTDHNPVLLKPRGNGESQLVVDGHAVGHYTADSYYESHWQRARTAATDAHERLTATHDVVVAEGAGSIAEINLHDRDLANVETARFADASIVLLGDVERGGVFASLYGTLELMPDDLRERVVGTVITKFRGDESILEDGVAELESRTGVPVLAVLPYDDPGLPAEDSLDLPEPDATTEGNDADAAFGPGGASIGADDGVPADRRVTVGVVRLPHVSNSTDFGPLARVPGVTVTYLDPGVAARRGLGGVDGLVLPGTKNTVDDLRALRRVSFDDALAAYDGPVLGICGGYQMLGVRITNASVESSRDVEDDCPGEPATTVPAHDADASTAGESVVAGFGRLPVTTRFSTAKTVEPVTVQVTGGGFLGELDATATGYEIHKGDTQVLDGDERTVPDPLEIAPLEPRSVAADQTLGTYMHGLFENPAVRDAYVDELYDRTTTRRPRHGASEPSPSDAAAELVAPLATALQTELDQLADGSGTRSN